MKSNRAYIYFFVDLIELIQQKELATQNKMPQDIYTQGQVTTFANSLSFINKLASVYKLPIELMGFDKKLTKQGNAQWDSLTNEHEQFCITILQKTIAFWQNELLKYKQIKNDLYAQGVLFAYYDLLSIAKEQAELGFDLDTSLLKIPKESIETLAF